MPLRLSTIALDGAGLSLLAHLPANPLAYIRGGDGLVGDGGDGRAHARVRGHGPAHDGARDRGRARDPFPLLRRKALHKRRTAARFALARADCHRPVGLPCSGNAAARLEAAQICAAGDSLARVVGS